jgi:hypothetical protein
MVKEALENNKATNMDLWRKAIAWKTHDGFTPQQVQEGKVPDLVGFQEIGCHIVFNVKMHEAGKLVLLPVVILPLHQAP